jgi:predicted alpha/beta-fold hydrolase
MHYKSPLRFRSGHLQTILGAYRPTPSSPPTEVVEVSIPPFGKMLAYRSQNADQAPTDQAVLLLHGLGGCHSSPYLVRIAKRLVERNHQVFRIDLPGAGPSWKLSPLPAHAGCSPQVGQAIRSLSEQFKIASWSLAGFSLSGNILLKTLIESAWQSSAITVKQGIVVAPPVDLHRSADAIERWDNLLYNRYFVKSLKLLTLERASRWPAWETRLATQRARGVRIRTLRQFDDFFTAPLAGFENANDYYTQSSTSNLLHHIKQPLYVLADRHDPIVPFDDIQSANWPATTQFTATRFGGHLGYFQSGTSTCWMDDWVVEQMGKA